MPAKHGKELEELYEQIAEGYSRRYPNIEDTKETYEAALEFVAHLNQGDKILDLGSGPGRDAEWFDSQGFGVTMFDISKAMLELASKRVPDAETIQGDMVDVEFPAHEFNGVWANASLLHLTRDEVPVVLKKINHALVPGGILFASFKGGEGEEYLVEDKYKMTTRRFFGLVTPQLLSTLIEEAGLELIRLWESDQKSYWIKVLARKAE